MIEGRIAAVLPMELFVGAAQIAFSAGDFPLGFGQERNMERGGAKFLDCSLPGIEQQTRCQRDILARSNKEFASGYRREWYTRLQLGIIAATRPRKRFSPSMIEYIFAVGMALQIKRKQRHVAALTRQHKVHRFPAGFCR